MLRFNRYYLRKLRRTSQTVFALFCIYIGLQFYQFHQWAIEKSSVYVPRPPSVEAFLPISALMGLKRLLLTGNYDPIHPAGLTIFIAALTLSCLFRKGFCGWICPIGFASNLAEKTGVKLKSLYKLPRFLDWPLLSLKYILLSFFLYLIVIKMNIAQIESFLRAPYNLIADAKMLYFFLSPGKVALSVLSFLFIVSFFVKNFWCRYLCPYGALLGVVAFISPTIIKRQSKNCIDCKKCDKTCPGLIPISEKESIYNLECIGCFDCVSICPKDDCLEIRLFGKLKIHPFMAPAMIVGFYLIIWVAAVNLGYWHNTIPEELLKKYYMLKL